MQRSDLLAIRRVMTILAVEAEYAFSTFPLTRRSEQSEEHQAAFRTRQILCDGADAVEFLLMDKIPSMETFYVLGHSSGYDYGFVDEEELLNRLYLALEVAV